MFERNALYITPGEQEKIKHKKIFFGGAGLGSVIAEALVRLGFENLSIYDADVVEASNLNRQNYTKDQIGQSKTASLAYRLKSINPDITLKTGDVYLNADNLETLLTGNDFAINAIDFDDGVSSRLFDMVCHQKGIPVLHPFNFGWAGCLYIVLPSGRQIFELDSADASFELVMARHTLSYLRMYTELDVTWIESFLKQYRENLNQPPSQLVVGSLLTAGLTAHALFCLANDITVKTFPFPYFLSARL